MREGKPEDQGEVRIARGSPPEFQLGPFETNLGTVYTVTVKVHKRGTWVKALRLKAAHLPTDPETCSIIINEDQVIAL